jgi:hypothetical protein
MQTFRINGYEYIGMRVLFEREKYCMKRACKYFTFKIMTMLACEFSRLIGTSYSTVEKQITIV